MMKPPAKLPVKTRLPIQAWIFAGLVTLFSLASSLTHFNVPPTGAVYAGVSYVQLLSLADAKQKIDAILSRLNDFLG